MSDDTSRRSPLLASRRQIIKHMPLGAFVAALESGVASFTAFPRQAHAAAGGQIIDAFTQEAVNFNPLLYVNTGIETAVENSVFDAMWKINPRGEFVPNLAVEIPTVANGGISEDGLEWTIKLRPDVKWHDGQPFTAKDAVFTIEVLMDPNARVRSRNGQDHVATYSAADAYTLKIKLKDTFAPYVVSWQKTSVVPEHILSKVKDINTDSFNTNPIGTGPFKFKQRVAGDHIAFTPNAQYHGVKSSLSSLIQKVVSDQQTLYTQFRTGEVTIYDIEGIPPQLYRQAKTLSNVNVLLTATPNVEFVYFNCAKPQFVEKVVRQALYLAMDKQSLIDTVYYGLPTRTLSYLSDSHWAYNHALKDPGYDPAKAAMMLDQAGWRVGPGGVRQKNGVKLAFTMSTTAGDKAREMAQEVIQQNLKGINVAMTIRNMPGSVVWGEYTVKSQFDTLMVGWDPPLYPDPDYTDRIASDRIPAKGGNGSNYVQYQNPKIDKLCAAGVSVTDRPGRKHIYDQIQEILLEDLPFAPLFSKRQVTGMSGAVKGYQANPYTTCNSWNNNEWSIT
jgi:peptide/nickel transport system substrate-binding protein